MSPEALQKPPRYNETLDVFSFGNIILSILTHEWPDPDPPNQFKGDQLIALTELQRRERYVEMFTPQEKQLFLPTVRQCLENRPDKRPSSAVLVRELRRIESFLPSGVHVVGPVEQIRQQLSAKEEECRQKDEALKEKDKALKEKDTTIQSQQDAIQDLQLAIHSQHTTNQKHQDTIQAQQDTIRTQQAEIDQLKQLFQQLLAKDKECRQKDEALREKDTTIRSQQDTIQEQQVSDQAQRTTVQELQDTIRAQQTEIERLRKQPAVAKQVSCPFALDCSNSMYSISANDITESRPSFGSASEVITKMHEKP